MSRFRYNGNRSHLSNILCTFFKDKRSLTYGRRSGVDAQLLSEQSTLLRDLRALQNNLSFTKKASHRCAG